MGQRNLAWVRGVLTWQLPGIFKNTFMKPAQTLVKSSVKILVMVNSSPWGSGRSAVALRFVRAALDADHELSAIYFRGDGVYHAVPGQQADPGAEDLTNAFAKLAQSHGTELMLCTAALMRRFPNTHEVSLPWRAAGLAQWVGLLEEADRVVSF